MANKLARSEQRRRIVGWLHAHPDVLASLRPQLERRELHEWIEAVLALPGPETAEFENLRWILRANPKPDIPGLYMDLESL